MAALDATDEYGFTGLQLAAQHGKTNVLNRPIKAGVNVNYKDPQKERRTALGWATGILLNCDFHQMVFTK